MLRTTHKLTAISNPTPLLLKPKDSSKMMPAYPIPNSNAISTSYITRYEEINQGYNSRSITPHFSSIKDKNGPDWQQPMSC
jgi:hypothetical protein